jgi:hypothetical protein
MCVKHPNFGSPGFLAHDNHFPNHFRVRVGGGFRGPGKTHVWFDDHFLSRFYKARHAADHIHGGACCCGRTALDNRHIRKRFRGQGFVRKAQ